jgi:hypothetical protein
VINRLDSMLVLLLSFVTSKELKYMMVQSRDVGEGKRAMPQAITGMVLYLVRLDVHAAGSTK